MFWDNVKILILGYTKVAIGPLTFISESSYKEEEYVLIRICCSLQC